MVPFIVASVELAVCKQNYKKLCVEVSRKLEAIY